jgi:hypothetical protein
MSGQGTRAITLLPARILDLHADRTSAAIMRANQLRLWFASMLCADLLPCGA